jgi:hypothetical protein
MISLGTSFEIIAIDFRFVGEKEYTDLQLLVEKYHYGSKSSKIDIRQ